MWTVHQRHIRMQPLHHRRLDLDGQPVQGGDRQAAVRGAQPARMDAWEPVHKVMLDWQPLMFQQQACVRRSHDGCFLGINIRFERSPGSGKVQGFRQLVGLPRPWNRRSSCVTTPFCTASISTCATNLGMSNVLVHTRVSTMKRSDKLGLEGFN